MTPRPHVALLLLACLTGCGASSTPPAPSPPDNSAPTLLGVTSSQSYLGVGTTTQLSVSATDADGDSLHYQWSSNCKGTFTGADSASATFTPTEIAPGGCHNCHMDVEVEDGRGGQSTGQLWYCVSQDAVPREAPVIMRSHQSNPTGTADPVLTLDVEALDVQGTKLYFIWSNPLELRGTITSTETTSRFTLGLPCAASDQPLDFKVTVYTGLNFSASRTFTVPGRPACARWTMTGSLGTARDQHTATLLPDGRVLVVGGTDGQWALASAELYDPATGTWRPTGPLAVGRAWHTATLLPDGKVLVTGGSYLNRQNRETTELYDPATGTWSPAGYDPSPRAQHQAALLPNGRVLVTGGSSQATSVEYTPATRTWSPARSMFAARSRFTLTPLTDGRVLAMGSSSADVYDPDPGLWSPTGFLVTVSHNSHAAAALTDGRVLVTGGFQFDSNYGVTSAAQIHAPATGRWTLTGAMRDRRARHTATRLLSGQVLVVGGYTRYEDDQAVLASAELYDPTTGP